MGDNTRRQLATSSRAGRQADGGRAFAIITRIAEAHGLTWQDIIGPSKKQEIVVARKEAGIALYKAGFGTMDIAFALHRHWSTVSAYWTEHTSKEVARRFREQA